GMGLLKLMVEQFISRGITVLFEGLEEEHQIEFCQNIGVQLMQGYALARPETVPRTFDDRFPEPEPIPVAEGLRLAGDAGTGVAPPSIPPSVAVPLVVASRRQTAFGKRTR